ncbi:tautomerase family protein [Paraburkholderia sp. CNPSo 3274]|uniref:tautomerase family protein n=1 Tax=Paraburkholderia sp. CNPSo 3274 TaxID=2940932 RepID=UPI0020B6EE9E|nr:tautomerase family protein [Paraburkholderia sp. CNPSo 3274]MCP3710699.1 tautomerase family protein [Paraburkholderia sp. CNPSo 3274]
MPIVRIDIMKRTDPTFVGKVGKVVYESLKSAVNVPDRDNFQILGEHDEKHFVYDPTYLGIERTDDLVIIQITLNEGRTVEQKKLLYKTIADRLKDELAVRPQDVFIGLVEVKKENWSFGNGVAQYAV